MLVLGGFSGSDPVIDAAGLAKMVANGELDPKRIPLLRTMIAIVTQDGPADLPWDDFFAM